MRAIVALLTPRPRARWRVLSPRARSAATQAYARVSTDGQSVEAQVAELTAAGASKVFSETASGARSDRAQLKRAVAGLVESDVLPITRLDRLARSTRDLLNVLAAVAERGAAFRSLRDAWADTTTPHGRLMLTVLGGLAEFERRARARGVKLGPKHKLTPGQRNPLILIRLASASQFVNYGPRPRGETDHRLRQA